MISKGFFEALEAISVERSLEMDQILDKVEVALSVACKNNDVPYKGTIKIEADYEKKEIKFYNYYYVVEEEQGTLGGVTYDNTHYHVTVKVVVPKKLSQKQKDILKL